MFNFARVLLVCFALFSTSSFAAFVQPDYYNEPQHTTVSAAYSDAVSKWKAIYTSYASCANHSAPTYLATYGTWSSIISGCGAGGGHQISPHCPAGSSFNKTKALCEIPECPAGTTPNSNDECVPAPEECESGKISGPYKYTGAMAGAYVVMNPPPPPTACKNSCKYFRQYNNKCNNGTMGGTPFCLVSYVSDGSSCESTDSPDPEDPDKLPPLPDDGDDDGNTGDNGDGSGNNDGNGDGDGDSPEQLPPSTAEGDAKESTLKDIYNELSRVAKEDTSKKIADNTKKISDLIASTNGKLDGVIKAINDKPVGGGGAGNGSGDEPSNTGTASDNCDAPPASSGDALVGAVLHQQWLTMCYGEELKASDLSASLAEEGFTNADDLDDYLSDNAEDIDNKISGIVSGLFTSGPSNSCPVQDSYIPTKWGTIVLPWSMSCPIFNVISAVMFFFSYLAAAWILFDSLVRGS